MDEKLIISAAGALAALSVDHIDCATDQLTDLDSAQLARLAQLADRLGQLAAELAHHPVQLPITLPTTQPPAAPLLVGFEPEDVL